MKRIGIDGEEVQCQDTPLQNGKLIVQPIMTPNSTAHAGSSATSISQSSLCQISKNYQGDALVSHSSTTCKEATTSSPQPAKHWRVQFLKHASQASTARGIAGLTPPYCPAGPTLSREVPEEATEEESPPKIRQRSPLRTVIFSNFSPYINIKYDENSQAFYSSKTMPHAVSMPHSGFQALILCGPGIGLSSFTSVPSEYPKALINIANRPMVWYVLDWCYRMGVTDITLITPPSAKAALTAALGQNPYLTSLPSPSPDLLAPESLEFVTPTAELLRLPEVQKTIKSDFLLLPCDLICDVAGDTFLETYLTSLGGLGGIGASSGSLYGSASLSTFGLGGEGSGRRGGLSIWYNTANREESVKGEECDFLATTKLDSANEVPLPRINEASVSLRKVVSALPMSELRDTIEEDKGWKIRQSLLRKYGSVKCVTKFRDSHIYLFPYWVKTFAALNEDFESVSEDLVGTWAKAEWRKPQYRARLGVRKLFASEKRETKDSHPIERPIEDEIDLLSLSSTQTSQHRPRTDRLTNQSAQLASRVQAQPDQKTITADDDADTSDSPDTADVPMMPPILSYMLPSDPSAPLVRRVDTTPLLLSVSLLLAKIPSIEEATVNKSSSISPFAHPAKVAATATISPRVTISRGDTLIDNNTTVATQCVVKSSCIGSAVSIGTGSRITGCVIMDGATIGEKCVLTNTVVGKKAKIGKGCTLQTCEVQDGNAVADGTEGKGEKYLVGGLEDEVDGEELDYGGDDDDGDEDEGISLGA